MVAIVTGNGLGLGKSSAEVLGQGGQLGLGQLPGAAGAAYVNASNGNLVIQRQDELLIGRGPDIGAYQTYNSQGGLDFDNNDNWQVSLYRQLSGRTGTLNGAGSTITRTAADGSQLVYTYDSTAGSPTLGKYVNKDGSGSFDTLTYTSGTNTWVWQDGNSRIKESYAVNPADSSKWRITSVTDLDNNSHTYAYNATSGLIDSVTNTNNNEVTQLIYNPAKQLTQINVVISGVTTTRIRYTYESTAPTARLLSVSTDLTPADGSITDNNTYTTTYTYDGASNRIASISNSDGSKVSFTYEQSGLFRLLSISDYAINSSTISGTTSITYPLAGMTVVTDANGVAQALEYDVTGQLIAFHGVNNTHQYYTYSANGDVTQVTDNRGNWTKYTYDTQGNQLSSQDNLGNTVTRTYGSNNELLTQTVYTTPDANVSDTTLAASGAQTTRYTYDSNNHVRFTISAEGRVTEYRYNANGQVTSTHQYTDHLNTSTGNQTETIMNNWLTAAVKSKSQRTDYLYDARGQLSEQVVYTKVNATTGNEGVGIADGKQMRTQYVYDQSGNLLQKIDARGVATTGVANDYLTSYSYDGLNRLILTKQYDATGLEANAVSTQVTYTDASRQVKLTLANGLVTTSTYDLAGRLISVQKSDNVNTTAGSLGTTSYVYDKLGNLRMVTDAAGQNTYYLYDNANRKVGEIDENKNLTEWVYNANGQVIRTIQYKNKVTATLDATTALTNTLETAGVRPAADATNDRTSYRVYDQAGRLSHEIDALGYVTEYQYDGASRLLRTLEYNTVISAANLDLIKGSSTDVYGVNGSIKGISGTGTITLVADATNDRANRNLYDNDGKLVGSLDAEGYLTEYIYDKAGRQIQKLRYATVTGSANWATGNLATLKANATAVSGDTPKHQVTNYIYDAAGQLTGVVDPENYLTEYQYDLVGNKTQEIRYATSITYVAGNTVVQSRPASNNEDQKVTNTYDANNRILSTLSNTQGQVNGLLTNYSYDNVGNLTQAVKTFTGATSTQQRVQRNQYDSRGNLIAALSGEGIVALLALGSTPTQAQIDTVWNTYGTRYSYDLGGRLISKIEPNGLNATGNKTLYYYDAEGKLTYTVNALGEVSQTVYNSFDQVAETRRYNTRIASATLSGLTGGAETAVASAITGISTGGVSNIQVGYDKRGQTVSTTDELLNVNSRTYNAFGELNNRTDKIDGSTNVVTSYQYDRKGLLKTTTEDAAGINRITQAVYDAFGRVTQTTDGRNNLTNYSYDRLGRTVTTTDALSQNTTVTYDAFDRKVSLLDARGNTTSWSYNATNRTMTMTTAENISVVTTVNTFGEVVQVTDGRGSITSYQYNTDGQLIKTIEDSGSGKLNITTETIYDKAGRVYQTKDAKGTFTQYSYDPTNRVLNKTVDPAGLNLLTRYRYDAQGRQIWAQDAKNIWTRMDYDKKGQLTKVVTDPTTVPNTDGNGVVTGTAANAAGLNLATSYTYNARGKKMTVIEGDGTTSARTTQYVYDKVGRLTSSVVDPGTNKLNLTTSYIYDKNDNVVLKTDANGNKTVYSYDANDRLEYTVDALGFVERNFYDGNGNIVKMRAYKTALAPATLTALQAAPASTTVTVAEIGDDRVIRYGYDKDNRLTYTTNAEWFVTRNEFDANGNVVKLTSYINKATAISETGGVPTVTTNANDRIEQTVYDAANRATYSVDALNYVTANSYDANDNVVSSTLYANAMVGALATNTPPQILASAGSGNYVITSSNDQTTRYSYDKANRRTFSMEANGSVTQYDYDKVGQTLKVTRYANAMVGAPAVGGAPSVVTTAPGSGNYVLKDTTKDQVVEQKFDAAGRKTEAIDAEGKSTKTEYNAADDIVKVTDALGNVGYFYTDTAGRVTLQVDPEGAVTQTQYDGLGNATQVLRFANKVQTSGTGVLSTGASIQVVSAAPGGNSVYVLTDTAKDQKQTTEYDKLGQKLTVKTWTGLTSGSATTDYYTEGYTYTAFGDVETQIARNGLVTTYTYDKQSRKTSESFAGITVRNTANNGTVTLKNSYTYNAFGNLLTKVEADGALTTRTTTYVNDKLGRQQQATQSVQTTTGVNASAITQKTFDARGNLVAEKDANGNWTYTYYDQQDRRTGSVKADGSYTTWTYDALGNISQQTQYANKIQVSGTGTLSAASSIQLVTTAPGGNAVYLLTDASNDRSTLYTYDKVGRQTGTEIQSITTGSYNTASSQYQVSTSSITTKTEYDALGNIIKQTDGNGNVTRSWYNKAGQIVAKLDAENYLTVWTRDLYGNISQETRYANKVQTKGNATYTDSGIPTIVTAVPTANSVYVLQDSANDRTTAINYDKLNRVSSETINNVQAGSVNATTGTPTAAAPVNATTSYVYDGLNNITQKTDATSAITNWVYDGLGRQLSEINPQFVDYQNNTVRSRTDKEYDGLNNVTRELRRGKDNTAASTLSGQVETDDQITTYTYGVGGRLTSEKDATDAETQYEYDLNGNTIKRTLLNRLNADGVSTNDAITYTYDSLNRQTKTANIETIVVNEEQSLNLLQNSNFSTGTNGYTYTADRYPNGTTFTFGQNTDPLWTLEGEGTLWLKQVGVDTYLGSPKANNSHITSGSQTVTVQAGQVYKVSAYTGVQRATANLSVAFYNSAGAWIQTSTVAGMNDGSGPGGPNLAAYKQLAGTVTAPAGAVRAVVLINKSTTIPGYQAVTYPANIDSWLFVSRMYFGLVDTQAVSKTTNTTNEVKYNSFGEVSGKRVYTTSDANPGSPEFWDEFAEYDKAGRIWKSNSNDGVTKVYVYDNNGNATLTLTPTARDDSENLTSALLAAGVTISANNTQNAINATGTALRSLAGGTAAEYTVKGNYVAPYESGLTFKGDFISSASISTPTGRRFGFGIENTQSGNAYRRHTVYIHDQIIMASWYDPASQQLKTEVLGPMSALNLTSPSLLMVTVEVEVTTTGTTLYIYARGQNRNAALVHHSDVGDWGDVRSLAYTFGGPSVPASVTANILSRELYKNLTSSVKTANLDQILVNKELNQVIKRFDAKNQAIDTIQPDIHSAKEIVVIKANTIGNTKYVTDNLTVQLGTVIQKENVNEPLFENSTGVFGTFTKQYVKDVYGNSNYTSQTSNAVTAVRLGGPGVTAASNGLKQISVNYYSNLYSNPTTSETLFNFTSKTNSVLKLVFRVNGGTAVAGELYFSKESFGDLATSLGTASVNSVTMSIEQQIGSSEWITVTDEVLVYGTAQGQTASWNALVNTKQPKILFSDFPEKTETLELYYKVEGSADPYTVVQVPKKKNSSGFDVPGWFEFTAPPITRPNGSTEDMALNWSYYVRAKDSSGEIIAGNSGTIAWTVKGPVGYGTEYTTRVISNLDYYVPVKTLPNTTVRFDAKANVSKLTVQYRVAGSTGAYSSIDILPTGNTGFYWDAASLVPDAATSYEYEVIIAAYNSTNQLVQTANLNIRLGANAAITAATVAGADPNVQWVIKDVWQDASWVHRLKRYNAFGEVDQETDALGNQTDYLYNTMGRLIEQKSAETNVTLANGYIQRQRLRTTNVYDALGRLISVKDANANLYDANNPTAQTDIRNNQVYLNGTDQVLFERHADGGFIKRGYDIFGNKRSETDLINSLTDPTGRTTTYAYDAEHRLTQVVHAARAANTPGNATATAVSAIDSYTYDAAGNRISHTNALGDTEKTYYDSQGRVTKQTSYLGRSTQYSYTYVNDITGVGAQQVGGWQIVTTDAMGRTGVDRKDMFGRLTWHKDLGNHVFTYRYSYGGQLVAQSSLIASQQPEGTKFAIASKQNIVYQYYSNGAIREISDKASDYSTRKSPSITQYDYDKEGNRTRESFSSGATYRDASSVYDELNRITSIIDARATIQYEYDAVGNKRHMLSIYNLGNTISTQDYWYKYDAMNRFTVSMGQLGTGNGTSFVKTGRATSIGDNSIGVNKGLAGTDGVAISYDFSGQRKQVINASSGTTEDYTYSADGYLEDIKINNVLRARRNADLAGRVTTYTEWNASGTQNYNRITAYDKDSRLLSESGTDSTSGTAKAYSNTYYYYNQRVEFQNSTTGYYVNYDNKATISQAGVGELARVYNNTAGATADTYYSYQYWDEAKLSAISTQASEPSLGNANAYWKPGYSEISYDANGHAAKFYDRHGNKYMYYTSDAEGHIVRRQEFSWVGYSADTTQQYYYYNGIRIGDIGNDPQRTDYAQALAGRSVDKKDYKDVKPITSVDYDQNYEPIGPNNPGGMASSYVVKNGDTLQSIASSVWGDSDMWYLIADANGLSASSNLVAGQALIIPNKVTNIHNNTGTFKVYNPSEALGDIMPTIPDKIEMPPPPPKKKKGGCGGIGGLLVMVVTIVVAVYAPEYLPAALKANGFVAAASAAAVANVAGQITANATGIQKGFSFKSLGTAMLTAGIAEGLIGGTTLANGTTTTGLFGNGIRSALGTSLGGYAEVASRAMINNAVSQGVGNLTGLQKGFSWSSVAAAGVGAVAGNYIGEKVGGALKTTTIINGKNVDSLSKAGSFITAASQGVTASIVSQLTQISLDGKGKLNWATVAVSGIGAGVGALAGYRDPKIGASIAKKPLNTYDEIMSDLKKNPIGMNMSRGYQVADAGKYTGQSTTLGLDEVEVTAKRPSVVDTLVDQTADRLMQINTLNSSSQFGLEESVLRNGGMVVKTYATRSLANAANGGLSVVYVERLGRLSEKYETGGRGPGVVSSGRDDGGGGVSYGSYQLASKLGVPQAFLAADGAKWASKFDGLDPTVSKGEFEKNWKKIAEKSPAEFFDAQHDFIKKTHFDVSVNKIKVETGINVNDYSSVVKDVVWSTAVHNGPHNQIAIKVINSLDATVLTNKYSFEKSFIEGVYAERGRTNSEGKLVYFTKVKDQAGLKNRFINERNEALLLLQ